MRIRDSSLTEDFFDHKTFQLRAVTASAILGKDEQQPHAPFGMSADESHERLSSILFQKSAENFTRGAQFFDIFGRFEMIFPFDNLDLFP